MRVTFTNAIGRFAGMAVRETCPVLASTGKIHNHAFREADALAATG